MLKTDDGLVKGVHNDGTTHSLTPKMSPLPSKVKSLQLVTSKSAHPTPCSDTNVGSDKVRALDEPVVQWSALVNVCVFVCLFICARVCVCVCACACACSPRLGTFPDRSFHLRQSHTMCHSFARSSNCWVGHLPHHFPRNAWYRMGRRLRRHTLPCVVLWMYLGDICWRET